MIKYEFSIIIIIICPSTFLLIRFNYKQIKGFYEAFFIILWVEEDLILHLKKLLKIYKILIFYYIELEMWDYKASDWVVENNDSFSNNEFR